jgi:hypothetical protein
MIYFSRKDRENTDSVVPLLSISPIVMLLIGKSTSRSPHDNCAALARKPQTKIPAQLGHFFDPEYSLVHAQSFTHPG